MTKIVLELTEEELTALLDLVENEHVEALYPEDECAVGSLLTKIVAAIPD